MPSDEDDRALPPVVGRFAPSPTGPLHFGSLVAAVGSWLFARASNGAWIVRMEDLDTPRVVEGSADSILRSLELFALTWDGSPQFQSARAALYEHALEMLRRTGRIYECACSRTELRRAASAPSSNPDDMEMTVYPGTCREGIPAGRKARALRFRVGEERVRFTDRVHGQIEELLSERCGDFVVRRADGPFAYQLAVVVDDAAQHVTQVVRGGDLLSSTPRQIALQRALLLPQPAYAHLPLITDENGMKLGKRNGAFSLPSGNQSEISRCLAKALECLGQGGVAIDKPETMLEEALARFDASAIPRSPTSIKAG